MFHQGGENGFNSKNSKTMIIIEARFFNKKGEDTFSSHESYAHTQRFLAESRYDYLHEFIDVNEDTSKFYSWVTMKVED